MKKHNLIVLALIVLVLAVSGAVANALLSRQGQEKQQESNSQLVIQNDTVTYSGKDGVDALSLLKEQALVKQDPSGLVIEINNRGANTNKKEFWAFYINGKLASIGPSEYKTRKTDRIVWKIDSF